MRDFAFSPFLDSSSFDCLCKVPLKKKMDSRAKVSQCKNKKVHKKFLVHQANKIRIQNHEQNLN